MTSTYKLTYFNVTALAEPIRYLFSYGNIPFEDVRFPREEWPNLKEKMPFGQVPILEIDGKVINQSMAISRYLAKKVKLAGKNELESLEIDSMVDNINDLRSKIAVVAYEADEQLKEKKYGPLVKETVPYMCDKLDAIAKANNGHLACGTLTWADLYFAALVGYINFMLKFDLTEKYPNLKAVKDNVEALPAIKEWIAKRPKTDV